MKAIALTENSISNEMSLMELIAWVHEKLYLCVLVPECNTHSPRLEFNESTFWLDTSHFPELPRYPIYYDKKNKQFSIFRSILGGQGCDVSTKKQYDKELSLFWNEFSKYKDFIQDEFEDTFIQILYAINSGKLKGQGRYPLNFNGLNLTEEWRDYSLWETRGIYSSAREEHPENIGIDFLKIEGLISYIICFCVISPQGGFEDIWFSREDVYQYFPEPEVEKVVVTKKGGCLFLDESTSTFSNRNTASGRPSKFDVTSFFAELTNFLLSKGIPLQQKEIEIHMSEWYRERGLESPSTAWMRPKISAVLKKVTNSLNTNQSNL